MNERDLNMVVAVIEQAYKYGQLNQAWNIPGWEKKSDRFHDLLTLLIKNTVEALSTDQ